VKSETVRASLRDLMRATVRQERLWHYEQTRPVNTDVATLHTPVYTDCSGGIILLCRWAGAPNPSGTGAWGWGNSQSFYEYLPHVPADAARSGDIVVFGKVDGEQHAAFVYQAGADPLLWSHGQEAGPLFVRLSAELRAHAGCKATFLRLLPPDPEPRVDVSRDGKPWLRGQKLSNPVLWARVKNAARAARILIRPTK
jgi:hypothetical protein